MVVGGIFKFWRQPDSTAFDVATMTVDQRLRHHLGTRYDARDGVFDWDYHMRLAELAPIISSKEYKHWRATGLAFQLRWDGPYESPNRTLASGLILQQGDTKVARRGYWGDIVNSPFVSIGTESDNMELFKKSNGKHIKTSLNIAEHNLLQWLHLSFPSSIPEGVLSQKATHSEGAKLVKVEEEKGEGGSGDSSCPQGSSRAAVGDPDRDRPLLPELPLKVIFLPLGSMGDLATRGKYHKRFHLAYFSNSMVHHVTNLLLPVMVDEDAVIVTETAKYLLELKKEHRAEFLRKVTGMAERIGFKAQPTAGEGEQSHLVFTASKEDT